MDGKRIAAARNAKGWSQRKLGEIIGCSQQAIAKYESPRGDMSTDVLLSLSNALGVTISYLLGMDGGPLYEKTDPALTEIVEIYDEMSDEGRRALLASARGLAVAYPGEEAPSRVARSA